MNAETLDGKTENIATLVISLNAEAGFSPGQNGGTRQNYLRANCQITNL